MRMPLCIRTLPNTVVNSSLKSKKKRIRFHKQMKQILDDSVFLILNLEENVDFDYNDMDEVKATYYESFLKMLYPKSSNIKDKKIEYWNMHTYSNKIVDIEKVSLLKDNDVYVVSEILKRLIEKNMEYVKKQLRFLYEYYNYIYIEKLTYNKIYNKIIFSV